MILAYLLYSPYSLTALNFVQKGKSEFFINDKMERLKNSLTAQFSWRRDTNNNSFWYIGIILYSILIFYYSFDVQFLPL
jgi:hypothetical protein